MRIDIVRHVRGWNFHRIDRTGGTWQSGFSYSFTITRLLVIVPLRHRFTANSHLLGSRGNLPLLRSQTRPWSRSEKPSLRAAPGSGTRASVRGARRGKNSWSRSLHQYRAAIPSLRLRRPSSRLVGFIIISVLIDS